MNWFISPPKQTGVDDDDDFVVIARTHAQRERGGGRRRVTNHPIHHFKYHNKI